MFRLAIMPHGRYSTPLRVQPITSTRIPSPATRVEMSAIPPASIEQQRKSLAARDLCTRCEARRCGMRLGHDVNGSGALALIDPRFISRAIVDGMQFSHSAIPCRPSCARAETADDHE